MNTSPIILLGTQRSGTTLLARILNSHPSLFVQNEFRVDEVFTKNVKPSDINSKIRDQIFNIQGKTLEKILSQDNKACWGIKDPELTYHLDTLSQAFPESKVIIVVRDGRGVVNSYMRNKWGLGTNPFTGAERWRKEIKIQNEYISNHLNNCIKVNYESLIDNSQQTLEEICNFLNIDYSPEMLAFHTSKANFATNKQNQNTSKHLDINIMHKWKSELSGRQMQIIESIAKEELVSESYELIGPDINISWLEQKYYRMHQKIIGELQIQYQTKKFKFKMILKERFGFYRTGLKNNDSN